ncbi:MAG: nuclear transport factor 2 family protein [Thermoflexibacter sp.]
MRFCLITIFCFITCACFAQSKEEKQVSEAVEALKKALIDPTLANLEAIVAEELSYGHSSGKIEDKKAFMEALLSGKSDFISIELTDQKITVSKEVALVRHQLTAQIADNRQNSNIKLHVLLVWQKQKGKWKLLARQAIRV